MKKWLVVLNLLASKTVMAAFSVHVFVSFSMPDTLLLQTLKGAEKHHVPVYINGLHENSMKATALKIMKYSKEVPGLSLQIDPTAFEKYGIHQVPAVVVDNGRDFDVIYGNLSLFESLSHIETHGETGFMKREMTGWAEK